MGGKVRSSRYWKQGSEMIKITILGSCYGEALVISFDSEEGLKYGLIDSYHWKKNSDTNFLIDYLDKKLNIKSLAFVIATHPHDDHIGGLHEILDFYSDRVDWFGWWGGLYPEQQIAYFDWLEYNYADVDVDSNQIKLLFTTLLEKHPRLVKWHQAVDNKPYPFYVYRDSKTDLQISAISPWLPEQNQFSAAMSSRVNRSGDVLDVSLQPNQTSLGFFVQYHNARIILGGDVEANNWNWAFTKIPKIFSKGAHFIKVPHHGSKTGWHKDMWSGQKRFLNKGQYGTVTATTRFEKGRARLPNSEILHEINNECEAWVVAGKNTSGIINKRVSQNVSISEVSCFQVQVSPLGEVKIHPDKNDLKWH